MTRTRHRAPDAALDTRRPFTRADALCSGITAKALRGPGFRRLLRGVYVDAAVVPTPRLRARAALVPFPDDAFASHASAARVHGVPVPTLPDEHVTVLHPGHRRSRVGIIEHLARGRPARRDLARDVVEVDGIRVSEPHRMFVELAEQLGLVDLVVVGDHLVRRGGATPDSLRRTCAESDLPGAAAAARAATFVRERVDSPMETRVRMLLVLAGLPEPRVNLTLRSVDGVPLRRYDLSYPAVRVIVEYDGRHHIERERSWESDLARREAIDDDGWRILVVTAAGVYKSPNETVLRVWRLLHARGLAGVPARPLDEWRPHFPGHGA